MHNEHFYDELIGVDDHDFNRMLQELLKLRLEENHPMIHEVLKEDK